MRRSAFILIVILAATLSVMSCSSKTSDFDNRVDYALDYAVSQLKKSVESIDDPSKFARTNNPDGSWKTVGMYNWTSGHFPGCLWYAYEYSKDESLKDAAIRWTEALEPVKDYTENHDVGFMIYCSYGNGYRLTGDESYPAIMKKTAESLATRYTKTTGVIQSWRSRRGWLVPVIIDNMMNLELMFWAAKNNDMPEIYELSVDHSKTTIKNHIRENGSTYHVVDYDPDTGDVRGKQTAQGYADDSTWARGQAWGLYGYTMTYRETRDKLFLKTAQRLADFFIANLPEDYVPYWDFNAPNIPDEPRDSSAAAIAASGLLELCELVEDKEAAKKYRETALNLLSALCSSEYLTEGTNNPAILQHGTGHLPGDSEIDVALIYGDYYFLEALLRYKRGI